MIYALVLAFIAGLGFGGLRARRRGGNGWDVAQYAMAHGLAALVAVALALVVIGLALPTRG